MNQPSDSSPVLFAGNASIDVYLENVEHTIEGDLIRITNGKKEISIPLNHGTSDKRDAAREFYSELQGFQFTEKFGGGALNSVREFRKIVEQCPVYLDPARPAVDSTVPGTSLREHLREQGIPSEFISATPMPVNIILGDRDGKLIVKSPRRPYKLSGIDEHLVRWLPHEWSLAHVVINSLKDPQIAEWLSEMYHVYGVITTSLEPDFVLNTLAQKCTALQFNYDEFGFILDESYGGNENDQFESAIEGIVKLRKDHSIYSNVYVTMGKNGVLVSTYRGTAPTHVVLKEETSERVQAHVENNPRCVTGAGDAFAAHMVKGAMNQENPIKIAIDACVGSVKYLGFHGISAQDYKFGRCYNLQPPKNYFHTKS